MNLFKKDNGAVSVFLVLILVPCIAFSCLFVELGRVHMSKTMANSASDLALNSLLTNYDAELNEWYGLVASCQSIEEFYDVSAEFFLRTISSQGLDEDEIFLLSDYYSSVTGDESIFEIGEGEKVISDLLRVEPAGEDSPNIAPVEGANFSKPTIIQEGVVEFMKYRAPIEITVDIIDRFKATGVGISGAVEAEKNDPLISEKTEFYEAEGELLSAAFNSYDAIRTYWQKADSLGLSNDTLKDYRDKINNYKDVYKEIHTNAIKNLYNTEGLSEYTMVSMSLGSNNSKYSADHDEIRTSEVEDEETGEIHYYVSKEKIKEILNNLEITINNFNITKNDLVNDTDVSTLLANMPGTGANQAYEIQWWAQMNEAINSKKYAEGKTHTELIAKYANEMLDFYSRTLAMESCELDPEGDTSWHDDWRTEIKTDNGVTIDSLKGQVVSLQGQYLTHKSVVDNSDPYLKAVTNLQNCSTKTENKNKINLANCTVTVDGESKTYDAALNHIKTELTNIKTNLQACIDLLNVAIDGNEGESGVAKNDKVKSLDKLAGLADTYKKELGEWKGTANSTSTNMATENQTEIASLDGQMANEINSENVKKLKTRLTNIRSQLQIYVTAIDKVKFGNSKLTSIDKFSTFKSKAGVNKNEIKLTNSELTSYANTTFGNLFKSEKDPIITISHVGNTAADKEYDPRVNPDTGKVAIPKLLKFFYDKFGMQAKSTVKEKQDELDAGKTAGSNKSNEAKDKGRYDGGGSNITKDFSGSGTFSLAEGALDAPLKFIQSMVNGNISDIRDDLYVTTYVMNMFSYATYDNEGRYKLINEKDKLTIRNHDEKYKTVDGSADATETWLSENPKDHHNKSLTNKLINNTNNLAYEAEIEYILYGGRDGKGNAENVKSVYSDIYGIKYVLNLVSSFQHFWGNKNNTGKVINAIATSIAAATSGIIPAPLTKVIILPILTAFETAMDLDRLEAGFPVELYKTKDEDWFVKVPDGDEPSGISGLTSVFSGEGPLDRENPGKGLFYSDYITIFVYMGLSGDKAGPMYQRMAEVIQSNVKKVTGASSYSLTKAHTYFKLDATMQLEPLMINLPIFNQYEHNLHTNKGWCTYSVSNTRGY